jgi:hypothetical protein
VNLPSVGSASATSTAAPGSTTEAARVRSI